LLAVGVDRNVSAGVVDAVDDDVNETLVTQGHVPQLLQDGEGRHLAQRGAVAARRFQRVQIQFILAEEQIVVRQDPDVAAGAPRRAGVAGPDERAAAVAGAGVVDHAVVVIDERPVERLVAQQLASLPFADVGRRHPDTINAEVAAIDRVAETDQALAHRRIRREQRRRARRQLRVRGLDAKRHKRAGALAGQRRGEQSVVGQSVTAGAIIAQSQAGQGGRGIDAILCHHRSDAVGVAHSCRD
jgi:hypothetical protein